MSTRQQRSACAPLPSPAVPGNAAARPAAELRPLPLLGVVLMLGACGSFSPPRDGGPGHSMDFSNLPDPVPRHEPRSRYGNPPSYEVNGRRYHVMQDASGYVERGLASWYGTKFHGRLTSTREPYNMYAMTAAHKTLPLPTYVQVTNLQNGRTVVVRVNDRGPFHDDRIIDLSYAAASRLGIVENGTAPVEVRALLPNAPVPRTADIPLATPAVAESGSPAAGAVQPAALETAGAVSPSLYLQVGAFSSRSNAEQLRSRLAAEFSPIRIEEVAGGANPLYRVQIGPIGDPQQADALVERLSALGVQGRRVLLD